MADVFCLVRNVGVCVLLTCIPSLLRLLEKKLMDALTELKNVLNTSDNVLNPRDNFTEISFLCEQRS